MDNLQMFFPCPSAYPHHDLSTTMETSASSHVLTHFHAADDHLANGFLDLKTESAAGFDDYRMIMGGGAEDEVELGKKKKKVRKPRYAFQTRSQVDILDDGYRWRKYGQKAVKNNKFPRSYYRCTQQGCNVKKQVQRLTRDEGVVVTTYEGMHTHSIDKPSDNFEQILSRMQIYTPF